MSWKMGEDMSVSRGLRQHVVETVQSFRRWHVTSHDAMTESFNSKKHLVQTLHRESAQYDVINRRCESLLAAVEETAKAPIRCNAFGTFGPLSARGLTTVQGD